MNKVILGCICSFLITTCEMPEKITVKGSPGLYVPLGSPFTGMKEGERLEDLISPDKIREMMNKGASKAERMEIYEVSEAMAKKHGIDENKPLYARIRTKSVQCFWLDFLLLVSEPYKIANFLYIHNCCVIDVQGHLLLKFKDY